MLNFLTTAEFDFELHVSEPKGEVLQFTCRAFASGFDKKLSSGVFLAQGTGPSVRESFEDCLAGIEGYLRQQASDALLEKPASKR